MSHLSIFDNIILPAYTAKKISRKDINDRARQLMIHLGIEELAEHDITQASGGQLQRVAICRALINEPEIIFGDEPTGALNSKSAEEVLAILKSINETGTTILLVTHDVKVAAKTDRVLYMLDGKLVGEKQLGTYGMDDKGSRLREEVLTRWLMDQGF